MTTSNARYKPLIPKELAGDKKHVPQHLQQSCSDTSDANQQVQDLVFINMTDPQQSKTHESRKLVRKQAMVNFAREKRCQQKATSSDSTQLGGSSSVNIYAVQGLLDATMPIAEAAVAPNPKVAALGFVKPCRHDILDSHSQGAEAPTTRAKPHLQHQNPKSQPVAARLRSSTTRSTNSLSDTRSPHWPVESEPHVQDLVNHCHSPLFKSCYPHYMISLLANRLIAGNYPFFIDIGSTKPPQQDSRAASDAQSEFYRLAEGSPMLAHALLMIGASHLAVLEGEDAVERTVQAIDHKSKALQLLNEATKALPENSYVETLATIAVLASYELMAGHYNEWMIHLIGFGRIVDLKGGLSSLPRDNLVRKLLIWTDQMGALFMNMRPFFAAVEVLSLFSRPHVAIAPVLQDKLPRQDSLSPALRTFASSFSLSVQLTEILEDIITIRRVGIDEILEHNLSTSPSSPLSELIETRDTLLHRILSLAPCGNESDDESSAEECVRLAALIFVLDRLCLPVLPRAYHRIVQIVTERLSVAVEGKSRSLEWVAHGWVLMWIIFVGATVPEGNAATQAALVHSAAPLCKCLFNGPLPVPVQLRVGLALVVGRLDLFEAQEELLINNFATELELACRLSIFRISPGLNVVEGE